MVWTAPPSLALALRPTPIEPLPRLTSELGGPPVFVKRDDLTGCALSGNKVRKLEFLAAKARIDRCDTLITCGGLQSNHARATALVAAKLSMKAVLVLRGERPSVPQGNLLLDLLSGARIRTISAAEWRHVNRILEEEAEEERRAGGKPMVIPEGGSNALGAVGYVEAVREIAEQSRALGVSFSVIVHAVGSGGTTAGLMAGARLFLTGARVAGVNVCDDAPFFQARIGRILEDMASSYGAGGGARSEDVWILEGYKGEGYAKVVADELRFYAEVARRDGLVLDPIYTGKAFRGMVEEIRKGTFSDAAAILFLHTGGIFGNFALEQEWASVL